jgi:hypothetical protein
MSDTLHKVAERIGMYQAPFEDDPDQFAFWHDPNGVCCDEVDDDDPNGLRTYLLTGDRPLRILAAYRMDVVFEGTSQWKASREWEEPWVFGGIKPTPAEAILACAEACSG